MDEQSQTNAARDTSEATARTTPAPATQVPAWFSDYVRSFQAGEAHTFILHGDIAGYAAPKLSQRGYLMRALEQDKQTPAQAGRIVVCYDRATGITFADDNRVDPDTGRAPRLMRQEALTLLGLDQPSSRNGATGANIDPMEAAIAARLAGGTTPAPASGANAAPDDVFSKARKPEQALAVIERLLREPQARGQVACLIAYADLLLPAGDKATMQADERTLLVTLLTWAADPQLARTDNPIFLFTAKLAELHQDLRAASSRCKVIEMRLPDLAARLAYIQWYEAMRAEKGRVIPSDLDNTELANLTAGLSLPHIEDIMLLAAKEGRITRQLVKGRKDQIIQSEFTEVAEMIEPLPGGFADLGGMEHLKAWARDEVIDPIRAGQTADSPKGVLLVGPPGSGKSYFVRSLAQEVGYNAVALRAENILGGIVGESEAKLRRFFDFCRALAPVLVFVDEIDQSDMAQRGNTSGNPVASNLFNQMLQFLSDETLRGKVILVFATNRPDLLDPALLRFGRMDAIIPVLLPEEPERRQIAEVQAKAQGASITVGAVAILAKATDRYSSADLSAVVSKARKLARRDGGRTEIRNEEVTRALSLIRPATPQTAEQYTLLAVQACNDGEHLPPAYARLLTDRPALDKQARTARRRLAGSDDDEEGFERGERNV